MINRSLHKAHRRHILKMIERNGYTRTTIADHLPTVSRSALCRFFQEKDGNHMPVHRHSDLDWFLDACDLLRVDPTTLLGWTPPDEPLDVPNQEKDPESMDLSPF